MFKPESVKFSVQPRQNTLVTPDHPLFQHAMNKLQIYKRQMQRPPKQSEPHIKTKMRIQPCNTINKQESQKSS